MHPAQHGTPAAVCVGSRIWPKPHRVRHSACCLVVPLYMFTAVMDSRHMPVGPCHHSHTNSRVATAHMPGSGITASALLRTLHPALRSIHHACRITCTSPAWLIVRRPCTIRCTTCQTVLPAPVYLPKRRPQHRCTMAIRYP